MSRFKLKLTLLIFFFLLLPVGFLLAGTSGKIAGRVTDSNTGEPLFGVNIILSGSTIGAATDLNGNYTILNVPPGEYTLQASMIGYTKYIISEVQVLIDLTTTIDIQMAAESLNLSEVVIVAEKKQIQRDVSSATVNITSKDIDVLPVSSVVQAVELQAGVESGFVIRGGASNQALFLLDGTAQRSARNNEPVTDIALSAVQDVSLEKGGFNAEYGQVRSGILNIVTRDGDKSKYFATATFRFRPPGNKFFGISPYDPNSIRLRPYLDPDVAYVGTENGTWDIYTQMQYPKFEGWNVISQRTLNDSDPNNDLTPEGAKRLFEWHHRRRPATDQIDYNIDAGFGGPVPFISEALGNLRFFASFLSNREMYIIPLTRDDYKDFSSTLKLTSDITSTMKLNISGIYGKSYNIATDGVSSYSGSNGLNDYTDYIRSSSSIVDELGNGDDISSPLFSDAVFSLADITNFGLSGGLTHAPTSNTFYKIGLNFYSSKYNTGPAPIRDFSNLTEIYPGLFVGDEPFGFNPGEDRNYNDPYLVTGGNTSRMRDSTRTSALSIKFDLTSQINFNHQIKTGVELIYNSLDLNFGSINLIHPESNVYVKEKYNPYRAAFYVQDKIEYNGFVANIGVRLDYSNANVGWANVDQFDPKFFAAGANPDLYPKDDAKGKLAVSPRIGIAHPVTENSKLYFNYGHFQQLPGYETLLEHSRWSGKVLFYGNPNLPYSKTISYELGYDQVFFDDFLFQIAGFYRDISNQLSNADYLNAVGTVRYGAIQANSYEDIRGFEITLKRPVGTWFRGFATYTYQASSSGRFGRDNIYEDPSEQRRFDQRTGNFVQSRSIPTPWAHLVLTFATPAEFGGEQSLNRFLLSNWSLTLLGDWYSGGYTTYNPFELPNIEDNVKNADYYNLDLRVSKDINLGMIDLTFLIDINNALNLKHLTYSFEDGFDEKAYWNSLHLPRNVAYDNIVGDDYGGIYRDPDVDFQPIERVASVDGITNPQTRAFYYERTTGRYMQYINGNWQQVDNAKLQQVLDDKAYIDMPNQTSFNFLNPRHIYFGIKATINF